MGGGGGVLAGGLLWGGGVVKISVCCGGGWMGGLGFCLGVGENHMGLPMYGMNSVKGKKWAWWFVARGRRNWVARGNMNF